MKKTAWLLILICIFSSCRTAKNYPGKQDEDKALQDALHNLKKNSTSKNASAVIPVLYSNIQRDHLAKIKLLKESKDSLRWDAIIYEYHSLQNAYYTILNSAPAYKIVKPQDYNSDLLEAKISAAKQYYQMAQSLLENHGRDYAKKAFGYLKISNNYIPGYKDVTSKISRVYEAIVINIIVDSLQDNAFFSKSSWGKPGYVLGNEYFQKQLVKDLQDTLTNMPFPARYYTEEDARKNNIRADWVVDLKLVTMNIPFMRTSSYTTGSSTQSLVPPGPRGNDYSLGKITPQPLYTTTYAVISSTQYSLFVRAVWELNISDATTGKNINSRTFKEKYEWHHDEDGYIGDNKAGIGKDLSLYSNSNYSEAPQMREVLGRLYRKIYPKVKKTMGVALK